MNYIHILINKIIFFRNEDVLFDPKEKKPLVLNPKEKLFDQIEINFFPDENSVIKGFDYYLSNLSKDIFYDVKYNIKVNSL